MSEIIGNINAANILLGVAGLFYGVFFKKLTGLSATIAMLLILPVLTSLNMDSSSAAILLSAVVMGNSADCFDRTSDYKVSLFWLTGLAILSAVIIFTVTAPFVRHMGPADHFAATLLTLTAFVAFSSYNPLKAVVALCIGLMLSTVGVDSSTGVLRVAFNEPELFDGIDFITVASGVYLLCTAFEIVSGYSTKESNGIAEPRHIRQWTAGFISGLIPNFTERLSGERWRIFKNSSTISSFIPLFLMGIPLSETTAMILGVFTTLNITTKAVSPEYITGIKEMFIFLFIACVPALAINMIENRLMRKVKSIPLWMKSIGLMVFALSGVYTTLTSTVSLFICFLIGTSAFILKTQKYPIHLIIIGFLMGAPLENNLRRALAISNGDLNFLFSGGFTKAAWLLTGAAVLTAIFINKKTK
jgi:putative tricarboxylic transport membrane protein